MWGQWWRKSSKWVLLQTVKTQTKCRTICNSYTMGSPPVRGDKPQALASGLSYVQVDKHGINYFIPPTSVSSTLRFTRYFVL